MKKILLMIITMCCSVGLFAQTRITGTVVDSAGTPVIGATVVQKGTDNGTSVGLNGSFTLTLNEDAARVLQVSMIGYTALDVTVGANTRLTVTMTEEVLRVEEVVVVGYATQAKASVTGAISNIGADELKSTPTADVSNALLGRIPGLVSRQESGRPGEDNATLFIRGRASFNETSPLVLVDGVERSMSQINNEDIETMSILKDASATAVYGVRGANGVVLITTKRGRQGAPVINFQSEFGVTNYTKLTESLNAETVSKFMREGLINDGLNPDNRPTGMDYPRSQYDNYLYRTQEKPFTHPDNNFAKTFTKPGFQQRYTMSVRGGSDMVRYFVSVGYFKQTGMFETRIDKLRKDPTIARLIELSDEVDRTMTATNYDTSHFFERINARSNVDIKISRDLTFTVDLEYRFRRQNRPGMYDNLDNDSENMRLLGMFYRNAPQSFPLMNENGTYAAAQGLWRQNPLVSLTRTGFRADFRNTMDSKFAFDYKMDWLTKGLWATGSYAYDGEWENWRGMIERPDIFRLQPNGTYNNGLPGAIPARAQFRDSPTVSQYAELALRYSNSFGMHSVTGLMVASWQSRSTPNESNNATAARYSYVPHIYQSLIGRATYDYDRRYLVEVNMGYNGSNYFPKNHRYALFPAISLGWTLTQEPYFKKNDILTYFKLRGSYGKVGSDKIPGAFSYSYETSYINGGGYSFGQTWNNRITGLVEGPYVSSATVGWEVAYKYNAGVETRWLKDRLGINFDLFKENREGILVAPEKKTLVSGVTDVTPMNIGKTENRGYEIEVMWADKIGEFDYSIRGVYSYAHNTVLDMGESLKPYDYMYRKGNPIKQYIGYVWNGFFKSQEDIAASPQQFGLTNLRPGDMKYKDLNKDGIIDENDQCPIGYSDVPEVIYSTTLSLGWKGLEVSAMIQGALRSSMRLVGDIAYDNVWGNYYEEHKGRWNPETAGAATYPRFGQQAIENTNNYYLSDYWLYNGRYVRLKNVQVSYTFPKKWFIGSFVKGVRVFATGYNLLTWTKDARVDPESKPDSNGYFYPQQKIYNFGLNLTF